MRKVIKPFIPQILLDWYKKRQQIKKVKDWKKKGSPVPPPHFVKQQIIRENQKSSNYSILVETGTYLGAMVEAQKKHFKKIYSIELGKELFENANKKFIKDKNITIIQGDSGKVLAKVMKELSEPAIFWLDGHYSSGITARGEKDCPIYEELDAIFRAESHPHIILIDDARCFVGKGDYPTIEKLTAFIKERNDKYEAEIIHDTIQFKIKKS